jgi:hypothetical protein
MIIKTSRPSHNFTVISNAVIRDECLSYRARGILIYLLSQPPDWETSSTRLAIAAGEGRDAVRTALRELINVGYVTLRKEQTKAGHWVTTYMVTDTPWRLTERDLEHLREQVPEPVDNPVETVDNLPTGA